MLLKFGQPDVDSSSNILDIEIPREMERAVSTGHPHIDVMFAGDGIIPSTVALVTGLPGAGKCLGKGTPVLLYDGTIKPVEEIRVGDRLMGPDSRPRNVLSLTRGREEMFEVCPTKGMAWTCNRSHILSLVRSGTDQVVNLSIDEYLNIPAASRARLKQYRTGVNFIKQLKLFCEPYMLGLWLGDGSMANTGITTTDSEIRDYLHDYAYAYDYQIREYPHWKRPHVLTIRLTKPRNIARSENMLRKVFKTAISNGEKRIPHDYLTGDRNQRLELLAGLIDADGHLSHGGYEITTKYPGLKDDLLFLARSLGFAAYSSIKNVKSKKYHRVFISGDISGIPVLVRRKRAYHRKQIKNVLHTGIEVKSIGVGDYYGFQIDGDHLFVLGDFTVTHNTTLMIEMADRITGTGNVCLYNTGEESLYQVRRVTKRLNLEHGFIPATHTCVDDIIEQLKELAFLNPGKQIFYIQDSIPCLEASRVDPETGEPLKGRPKTGLNSQVEAVTQLTEYIKSTFGIALLIGHVTKDGTFAGKQALKHVIDCHLHLGIDTDRKSDTYGQRVAEMLKNRFGPAGLFFGFELTEGGLKFEMANGE